MANDTNAQTQIKLYKLLCDRLIDQLSDPEVDSAVMNCARALLKDMGFTPPSNVTAEQAQRLNDRMMEVMRLDDDGIAKFTH